MALDIGLRIAQALNSIGIKMGSYVGKSSNVRKAMFGGKPTMFKPRALETLRGVNGTFDDALKLIEEEAQFIVNATDAEKMAFLNNVNEYKEFGGPLKTKTSGILNTDEAKNLTNEAKDLETSITDLQTTAQSMKDEATANLKSAEDDLATFFETGGNPLNKKDKKFLGGSMSEEGQIRTGVREFLKKEFKNGRINLDETDAQRILQYSPMSEDDPILVFKKIYGDEAYKKAGSFPGAFDVGESYNHYESIFRSKMGEDILKVKDKKYVGDGKLVLTESEEVFTPSKFDDDIPFAKGGIANVRVGFVKGKAATKVKQLIEYIKKQFSPMDAMKEVNKVIGKQGKYKNLTQKDIDEIVEKTEDFIFQRDPDDLYVGDKNIDDKKRLLTDDEIRDYEAELGDSETWMMDGTVEEAEKALVDYKDYEAAMKKEYDAASPAERAEVIGSKEPVEDRPMFKKKTLPKIDDKLLKNYNKEIKEGVASIMKDTSPEGLAKSIEIDNLMLKYPGMDMRLADQIASSSPTMKSDMIAMVEQTFELDKQGKSGDEIIEIFKNTPRTKQADGGITQLRNGYYGGGQAMVGEDLSQIGHGSDSLMARNMQLAPNSMATTSTGLNYLLGEDNDTVRVPYNEGKMVLPKPKPAQSPLVELSRIYKTYEEAMPGVSKDTQQFLQNDFIQKLQDAGISQEAFMTYKMQNNFADGGPARKGFKGGGSDASTTSFSQSYDNQHGTNTASRANKTVDARQAAGQRDADRTNDIIAANQRAARYQQPAQKKGIYNSIKNNRFLNNPFTRGALRVGAYTYNPALMGTDLRTIMQAKDLYDKTNSMINNPTFEEEDMTLGIVSEQQQKEIDKAATMANAMNNTGKLTNIEKTQIFNDVKPFDDKGSSGVFGIGATEPSPMTKQEFDTYIKEKGYADGGIAGLRKGYVGGGGVNLARRGFLKLAGATVASVAALKTGLVKILGKTAAKAVPKMVTIPPGSGAPAWFEGMVNKVLADGIDITKKASTLDGQVVKSLDTPTGKVDVTFDTRTGSIDAFYKGENTALGESVDMRYTVGQADEGTKGAKPADEFEAVEAVPEMQGYNEYDVELEFGENVVGDIKGLYSDTSELAELGGQKMLIKDISESIKKKKVLKEMNRDPQTFATDLMDQTGIPADPPHDALTKMRYHEN